MEHQVDILLLRDGIAVIAEAAGHDYPETCPIHFVGFDHFVKQVHPILPGQASIEIHHSHRIFQAVDMVLGENRYAIEYAEIIKDAQPPQETKVVDRDEGFFPGEDFAVDVYVGIDHLTIKC